MHRRFLIINHGGVLYNKNYHVNNNVKNMKKLITLIRILVIHTYHLIKCVYLQNEYRGQWEHKIHTKYIGDQFPNKGNIDREKFEWNIKYSMIWWSASRYRQQEIRWATTLERLVTERTRDFGVVWSRSEKNIHNSKRNNGIMKQLLSKNLVIMSVLSSDICYFWSI